MKQTKVIMMMKKIMNKTMKMSFNRKIPRNFRLNLITKNQTNSSLKLISIEKTLKLNSNSSLFILKKVPLKRSL